MYDNKIRLSQDVLEKAEIIAQEWGLKNARAAVEAVFRRYADEYLARASSFQFPHNLAPPEALEPRNTSRLTISPSTLSGSVLSGSVRNQPSGDRSSGDLSSSNRPVQLSNCEALNELDDLLGL